MILRMCSSINLSVYLLIYLQFTSSVSQYRSRSLRATVVKGVFSRKKYFFLKLRSNICTEGIRMALMTIQKSTQLKVDKKISTRKFNRWHMSAVLLK